MQGSESGEFQSRFERRPDFRRHAAPKLVIPPFKAFDSCDPAISPRGRWFTCHNQTSLLWVLCSFPLRFQHSLNRSICPRPILVSGKGQFGGTTRWGSTPHLCFAGSPILLVIVTIIHLQLFLWIYENNVLSGVDMTLSYRHSQY